MNYNALLQAWFAIVLQQRVMSCPAVKTLLWWSIRKCDACCVFVMSFITQLARHGWQTNANKMNERISIWHLSEMFASSCVPSYVWSRCYYVYLVMWLNHTSHTSNIIYMMEFKVQCACLDITSKNCSTSQTVECNLGQCVSNLSCRTPTTPHFVCLPQLTHLIQLISLLVAYRLQYLNWVCPISKTKTKMCSSGGPPRQVWEALKEMTPI